MDEPRPLGGRYRIGNVLGRGGMAAVRIGTDERLGRTVAVKILRADLEAAPTFRSRFRREARAAAALDHPAIVKVYDTGEDVVDGMTVPYIVMEYVDGHTLAELQSDAARIPPERALSIMADVLGALDYSHRAGIVHRDVKPANIMLTPTGAVKVMDFGIARVTTETAGTMTGTSTVIGTAHYLSPEQARGEGADARSDVYSAGCTLYALLANRPPFLGDSAVSVAYQHVREEPHPPSAFAAGVPPAAEAITMKALAKAPEDRYESAAQMRDDIVRALAGQPIIAAAVQGAVYTGGSGPVGPVDPDGAGGAAAVTSDIPMSGGEGESADEKSRRRMVLPATIAVVLVVLVAVAAFAFGDLFNTGEGREGAGNDRRAPAVTETDRSPKETADDPTTEDDVDVEPAERPEDDSDDESEDPPAEEPDEEPTETPNETPSPTESPSETPTPTETPSKSPSETPTPSETPSDTPTPTEPSETPTETTSPTESEPSSQESDDAPA